MLNCNIFFRVCTKEWIIPSKSPIDSYESTTEEDYPYEDK